MTVEDRFRARADALFDALRPGEHAFLEVGGESTDFLRVNHAQPRQAGHVLRERATVRLLRGRCHATVTVDLAGTDDDGRLRIALDDARALVEGADEDPYLLVNTEPGASRRVDAGQMPLPRDMVDCVVEDAVGLDLVGILAAGPIWRGLASSYGLHCWHEVRRHDAKVAAYLGGDRAVQTGLAGADWSRDAWRAMLSDARGRLEFLRRPARALSPGRYRCHLLPAAVDELLSMMNMGGFSAGARRTGASPLAQVVTGQAALHPSVTLTEDTAHGWAPAFTSDGFLRPARVPLLVGGRTAEELVSPRSAREFGIVANGAEPDEAAQSLALAPGDLDAQDVLARLGTGLLVGNLWYLNFSDRPAGRVTGMTRFATFWVEDGQVVAPVSVMRFDESLLNLFGSQLVALGSVAEALVDNGTYGGRGLNGSRVPGLLVEGMAFTL
jgi:predicted Zn-dependent protease